MKGRIARRRTRARSSSSGFTLIELMVVVLLVALLAMLAAPSFTVARNDRLAFSYARQASELVHNARARSGGRGAAHLVVFSTEWGARGSIRVFEALDGVLDTAKPPGPNPVPGCRGAGQWDWVKDSVPQGKDPNFKSALIDGMNINSTATGEINVTEDITMVAGLTNPDGVTAVAVNGDFNAFVICTTPNGTTYFGSGSDAAAAIANMNTLGRFTDVVEIDVARHKAGAVVGLKRRVIVAGAAAPRIKSE